jgi:hypothetical protein
VTRRSPLDNPDYSQFAWKRYWRLMRWMFGFSIAVTVVVLGIFRWVNGVTSIHFYIATTGAVVASIMLMAALMGLVFLSSGTGHDEAVEDPFEDESDT